jgi:ankyrin repeat protein
MSKSLPTRPSLEQLRNQAKDLRKQCLAGDQTAIERIRRIHPNLSAAGGGELRLHEAQLVIAREYGFASWTKLKEHVESVLLETGEPLELFKQAFHGDDAPWLSKLLKRYPQFAPLRNEPIGPFDSPAILHVRSREMLEVLLEAGADINAKSRWWAGGFGVLHHASPDLAAYAIERGAVVDVHAAARLGMLDRLRELITANPQLVHARGGDGQTPLHFASTIPIAALLLDHGADLDARDVDHESTPAQWMLKDRPDIARFLVQRGCRTDLLLAAALGDAALVRQHLDADPDDIRVRVSEEFFPKINPKAGGTIYEWTLGGYASPHEVARQFGHEEVFRLLMERSPDDVKLIAGCWTGDEPTVKSLLQKHPKMVASLSADYCGQAARAARNNNLPAVRLMLAAGLPVDALGQHRATALHWAAFQGNAEMTQEILRYHPPLELTDADFKSTPLGWAIYGSEKGWPYEQSDYARTVELILQAGAKLPPKISGTAPVRDVLGRYGAREDRS